MSCGPFPAFCGQWPHTAQVFSSSGVLCHSAWHCSSSTAPLYRWVDYLHSTTNQTYSHWKMDFTDNPSKFSTYKVKWGVNMCVIIILFWSSPQGPSWQLSCGRIASQKKWTNVMMLEWRLWMGGCENELLSPLWWPYKQNHTFILRWNDVLTKLYLLKRMFSEIYLRFWFCFCS